MAASATSGKEVLAGAPRPESGRKAYDQPCLIARALSILGDRWTLLILRDLMAGLSRYSDILENCQGMSPNVLSDRLKRLEAEGLIHREYIKGLPPRVEYTLTDKGWAVRPIFLALVNWGQQYVDTSFLRSVGTAVPADFAVRTAPTFLFQPHRAEGMSVTMVVEISDCEDCNTWSFEIRDQRLWPRRRGLEAPDIRMVTTLRDFFRFIRNAAPASECGEFEGDPETALAIQSCFSV